MRVRTVLIGASAVGILAAVAIPYVATYTVRSRIGKLHTYELAVRPEFLTEELAMAKTRETLRAEGFDQVAWHPMAAGRTSAPDGRVDHFFCRNAIATNHGTVTFTNGTATRFVYVALEGARVVCRVAVPK